MAQNFTISGNKLKGYQAVADGKLTQEEADAVAKASSAGIAEVLGTGGHGPR